MKLVRLADVATFINGKPFKPDDWGTEGYPIIRIQNLTGTSEVFNYYNGEFDQRYLVTKGDLLISWSASLGVYKWDKEDGVLNQHIFKVILKENVTVDYLYYAVLTSIREMESQVHGSTMKHITKGKFDNIKIPLPDLPTQQKIAQILSEADKARQLRRSANALTDQFLQSTFLKMFGDPVRNEKGWERKKSGDLIQKSQYGLSYKSNKEANGLPILGMSNITYSGQIDLTKLSHVEISEKELIEYELEDGDIIFNRTNSTELVGKTAVWQEKISAVLASYLVRLKLKSDCNSIFFASLLNSAPYKKMFQERCKKAVGQSNISPTLLKEFPIYHPPLKLQQQFADIVTQTELLRERQRAHEGELEQLFKGLLQRYFG